VPSVPRFLAPALAGLLVLLPVPGGGGGSGGPSTAPVTTTADRAPSSPVAPERPAAPRWDWPLVPRPSVVRPFRAPAGPYGPGHRGVDLAGAAGAEVLAVEEGVVAHAGRVAGRGTVTVVHADGLTSTYEPVRPRVSRGAPVGRGEVLGTLEPPTAVPAGGHCLLASCLHLGARQGVAYLDPMLLLHGGRVRLLPLPAGQPTTG
jgi:murein DD-endopeptidase MepM/ murein hydrolase activator NlpD